MGNDLILRKLENLRFYLQRVKEKTPSSSASALPCADLDAQDIIA
jgi:hypothetical protein